MWPRSTLLSEGGVKGFDEALWLLSEMMAAGDRYAKLNGLDNPPPSGWRICWICVIFMILGT